MSRCSSQLSNAIRSVEPFFSGVGTEFSEFSNLGHTVRPNIQRTAEQVKTVPLSPTPSKYGNSTQPFRLSRTSPTEGEEEKKSFSVSLFAETESLTFSDFRLHSQYKDIMIDMGKPSTVCGT